MKPYLFIFEVEPTPNNPQGGDIGGAHATIIAFSDSPDKAKKTSINYITEYGWKIKKLEHALEPTPEQLSVSDVVIQSVYRKAELNGISAQFDAWPKKERPGVYSVGSLQMPPKNK